MNNSLVLSGYHTAGGRETTVWKIWVPSQGLSERTSTGAVHRTIDGGKADKAPE